MQRRVFLAAGAAALILIRQTAMAAVSADDARKFISNLGENAISSLTGSTLSPHDRETRFRALLVADFDMLGISKFVLGRYWKIAKPDQQTEFQKLLKDLLTQSYAKTFAQYAGEKFKVTGSLRTTHRSDFASAIQSNGGTVAGLLDALRQKVGSQ